MTFDCDLDLGSTWLNYGFCTRLIEMNSLPKLNENLSKGSENMERT